VPVATEYVGVVGVPGPFCSLKIANVKRSKRLKNLKDQRSLNNTVDMELFELFKIRGQKKSSHYFLSGGPLSQELLLRLVQYQRQARYCFISSFYLNYYLK